MYNVLARRAEQIAAGMAFLGGICLTLEIVMTCLSVIGRTLLPLNLGFGPVRGIYDVTEIALAAAVFAFLPWCQLTRGHASVDLLKGLMSERVNRLLDLMFDLAMPGVAGIGAWRLCLGMLDKLHYAETTLIAHIPVWQGYAASLAGAVAFVIVAAL